MLSTSVLSGPPSGTGPTSGLWNPVRVGRLHLYHRLVMAPMTRSRATPQGVLGELNARYYAQRASMGLLISEGAHPSQEGQGYMNTPGIRTQAQVAAWHLVADAVHAAGGHLVIQLMHTGRVGHPDNTSDGHRPVAPSAIRAAGMIFTPTGPQAIPEPHALTLEEVAATVDDFRIAAALAISAGADGVELHGANGYLLHQFLSSNVNLRNDDYGGSPAGRVRFVVETVKAVVAEIGADRTGLRISPQHAANDIVERDAHVVYERLVEELVDLPLAYLHVMHAGDEQLLRAIRVGWPGTLIVNRGGRQRERIADDIESGLADLVSVGALALANPDLPNRLRRGAPLNDPDPATFYGGGAAGYVDYLESSAA